MANCLSHIFDCLLEVLETLGLYEPKLNYQQAKKRLTIEKTIWEEFQTDRNDHWNRFQMNNEISGPLPSLVDRGLAYLESHHMENGVAVDLGCGISETTFTLLEKGWKVYAVDSSSAVLETLKNKVAPSQRDKLILVNDKIEDYAFPEDVHFIVAIDSIPYTDPEKIGDIFLKVKNALHAQGIFVCSLFPYSDNPMADRKLRGVFGAWMTTKNVAEAVLRYVDFPIWTVTNEANPGGLARQFHILAAK